MQQYKTHSGAACTQFSFTGTTHKHMHIVCLREWEQVRDEHEIYNVQQKHSDQHVFIAILHSQNQFYIFNYADLYVFVL